MKTTKTWTQTAKVCAIAAILLAATVAAAFAQTAADFTFDAATGTITKYSGFDTEITIPATIGGKPVTAIGNRAFSKAELTKVTIPNGITSIAIYAFSDNKLTSITIPGSVATIESYAFEKNQLTEVVVPEGVVELGISPFGYGSKLTSISLPSTLRSLGNMEGDPAAVILPANFNDAEVGNVGENVFFNYISNDRQAGTYTKAMPNTQKKAENFSYLETQYGAVITKYSGDSTRVRIPAELGGKPVKAIIGDPFTFSRVDAVQLPDTLTYIGANIFKSKRMASITLPAGLTYIGDNAFELNDLTAITIPEGVTYIGDSAFLSNEIAALTIPAKVTYIGREAFKGRDGGNKITALAIPGSVKIIGDSAFYGNPLTTLAIAQGVVSIGAGAFGGSKADTVTVPAGVTFIGLEAFGYSRTVIIPATVKRLGGAPVGFEDGVSFVLQGDVTLDDLVYTTEKPDGTRTLKAGRYSGYSGYGAVFGEYRYSAR